ncbi:hypothetical protein BBAD15_g11505 [Beauveria bassiana D1-5]|uniref:Uncharacterized protein n=1 Tax=Beauveria bassiana D1-5 TaxID=1245745 RepID=A0A0A2V627_BEABA|nr:hypothetical protein BBAD15_g11505 [Beauveria bassiana D1-5]
MTAIGGAVKTVEVERAAREFAAIIPEHEFSVAQIMSYIQRNWDSPAVAVRNSRKWVTQALKEKEDHCRESSSAGTVSSASSTAREAAEEGELKWLWKRRDAEVQHDIPRTKNRRDLSAAACITPSPSPCEDNHRHDTWEEDSPYLSSV